MIPFQLHRRLPLVRRPFYQRDIIAAERDAIAAERDTIAAERDTIAAERDTLKELTRQMARALGGRESHLTSHLNNPYLNVTSHLTHPYLIQILNRPQRLTYQPATPLPDVDFLARLASAFRQAMQRASGELGPIWGAIVSERHGEVAELAAGGDLTNLGRYLARLGETDLSHGFVAGSGHHDAARREVLDYHQDISMLSMDRILSLAEYLLL